MKFSTFQTAGTVAALLQAAAAGPMVTVTDVKTVIHTHWVTVTYGESAASSSSVPATAAAYHGHGSGHSHLHHSSLHHSSASSRASSAASHSSSRASAVASSAASSSSPAAYSASSRAGTSSAPSHSSSVAAGSTAKAQSSSAHASSVASVHTSAASSIHSSASSHAASSSVYSSASSHAASSSVRSSASASVYTSAASSLHSSAASSAHSSAFSAHTSAASSAHSSASSSSVAAPSTSTLAPVSSTPASSYTSAPSTTSAARTSSASSATSSAPAATSSSGSSYSPSGTKAGLSGYIGIQDTSGFSDLADYISWYSDYTATTPDSAGVQGVGMLWGNSTSCDNTPDLASRFSAFTSLTATATPSIMFGFYEPDCGCPDSSDITDPAQGASLWNSYLGPLKAKGTTLGSPSMCKQFNEDYLTPFDAAISTSWDITSIHINKNSVNGAIADIEYYVGTYGKPVWISEFACVDDSNYNFIPCTDQTEIDDYINQCVSYFQGNDSVVAYGPSNGAGLGSVWPLFDSSGALSASGTTYLNAIKAL